MKIKFSIIVLLFTTILFGCGKNIDDTKINKISVLNNGTVIAAVDGVIYYTYNNTLFKKRLLYDSIIFDEKGGYFSKDEKVYRMLLNNNKIVISDFASGNRVWKFGDTVYITTHQDIQAYREGKAIRNIDIKPDIDDFAAINNLYIITRSKKQLSIWKNNDSEWQKTSDVLHNIDSFEVSQTAAIVYVVTNSKEVYFYNLVSKVFTPIEKTLYPVEWIKYFESENNRVLLMFWKGNIEIYHLNDGRIEMGHEESTDVHYDGLRKYLYILSDESIRFLNLDTKDTDKKFLLNKAKPSK